MPVFMKNVVFFNECTAVGAPPSNNLEKQSDISSSVRTPFPLGVVNTLGLATTFWQMPVVAPIGYGYTVFTGRPTNNKVLTVGLLRARQYYYKRILFNKS